LSVFYFLSLLFLYAFKNSKNRIRQSGLWDFIDNTRLEAESRYGSEIDVYYYLVFPPNPLGDEATIEVWHSDSSDVDKETQVPDYMRNDLPANLKSPPPPTTYVKDE